MILGRAGISRECSSSISGSKNKTRFSHSPPSSDDPPVKAVREAQALKIMLTRIMWLDGPVVSSVRRMQDDALVPVVSDDPALLPDELHGLEVSSRQPLPLALSPSHQRCQQEGQAEGHFNA